MAGPDKKNIQKALPYFILLITLAVIICNYPLLLKLSDYVLSSRVAYAFGGFLAFSSGIFGMYRFAKPFIDEEVPHANHVHLTKPRDDTRLSDALLGMLTPAHKLANSTVRRGSNPPSYTPGRTSPQQQKNPQKLQHEVTSDIGASSEMDINNSLSQSQKPATSQTPLSTLLTLNQKQ